MSDPGPRRRAAGAILTGSASEAGCSEPQERASRESALARLGARVHATRVATRRALRFSEPAEERPAEVFEPLATASVATRRMSWLAASARFGHAAPSICHNKEIAFHQPLLAFVEELKQAGETVPPLLIGAKAAAKWRRHVVGFYGAQWAERTFPPLIQDEARRQVAVQAWTNDELALGRDSKYFENYDVQPLVDWFQCGTSEYQRDLCVEQFFRRPMRPLDQGGNAEFANLIARMQETFAGFSVQQQKSLFEPLLEWLNPVVRREPETIMNAEERQAWSDLRGALGDFGRNPHSDSWIENIKILAVDLERHLGIRFDIDWTSPREAAEARLLAWATARRDIPSLAEALQHLNNRNRLEPAKRAAAAISAQVAEIAPELGEDPQFLEVLETLQCSEKNAILRLWRLGVQDQWLSKLLRWPEHQMAWMMTKISHRLTEPSPDGSSLILTEFGAQTWLVLLKLATWQNPTPAQARLCGAIDRVAHNVMLNLVGPVEGLAPDA